MALQGHENDKPERKKLRGSSEELRALAQREREEEEAWNGTSGKEKKNKSRSLLGRGESKLFPGCLNASMISDPQKPETQWNSVPSFTQFLKSSQKQNKQSASYLNCWEGDGRGGVGADHERHER